MFDGVAVGWVIECFLRQPIPGYILKQLISALPFPSPLTSRLRRTFLLHRLNSDISAGLPPSTDTLRFLQLLLDGDLGASPSCYESLAAAYRAVVLHLNAASASDDSSSFTAVVEDLCSGVSELDMAQPALPTMRELLKELRALMTAASESDAATPVLCSVDTRSAAMDAIRACVTASFEDLGPSFIEQAASSIDGSVLGEPHGRVFDDDGSKGDVSSTSAPQAD